MQNKYRVRISENKPPEGFNMGRGLTTMARRTSGAAVALPSRRFLGASARCCAHRESCVPFISSCRDAERARRGARGQGARGAGRWGGGGGSPRRWSDRRGPPAASVSNCSPAPETEVRRPASSATTPWRRLSPRPDHRRALPDAGVTETWGRCRSRSGLRERAQFAPLLWFAHGRRPRYPLSSPQAAFSCRQTACLPSR